MKVLTIQQPWATLIMLGAKKIETRSWDTKYRGPLLIHASAAMPKFNRELCGQEPFETYVRAWHELPLGKIIGQVTLKRTGATDRVRAAVLLGIIEIPDIPRELAFGDFTPGRYGWYLTDIVKFKNPVPAKGKLGLWEFDEKLLHV